MKRHQEMAGNGGPNTAPVAPGVAETPLAHAGRIRPRTSGCARPPSPTLAPWADREEDSSAGSPEISPPKAERDLSLAGHSDSHVRTLSRSSSVPPSAVDWHQAARLKAERELRLTGGRNDPHVPRLRAQL